MGDDGLQMLAHLAGRVDGELAAFFGRARPRVPLTAQGPSPAALLAAVEELTLRGGKRLRPALAYLASIAVRPESELQGLVMACSSLELLQTYLLIHDDIMDGDEVRRGGATVHRMLAAGGDTGDPAAAERGRSLAILAGDLACACTRQMLEQSGARRRDAAARVLTQMEWEVIHGQYLDITGSPDVSAMHDLKTGSYTTRGPVRFGATLAGADEPELAALAAYAGPLGMAFQLRDDLLDITGDPARTGKPVGTDLREGRVSAVIQEAFGRASGRDLRCIERAWGAGTEVDDDALARALGAVVACGAVRACADRVRSLTERAADALVGTALRSEGRDGLASIAAALASRLA